MIDELIEARWLSKFSEDIKKVEIKAREVLREVQDLREAVLNRAQDKLNVVKEFEKKHQDD